VPTRLGGFAVNKVIWDLVKYAPDLTPRLSYNIGSGATAAGALHVERKLEIFNCPSDIDEPRVAAKPILAVDLTFQTIGTVLEHKRHGVLGFWVSFCASSAESVG
jgi:hypothetical protein